MRVITSYYSSVAPRVSKTFDLRNPIYNYPSFKFILFEVYYLNLIMF